MLWSRWSERDPQKLPHSVRLKVVKAWAASLLLAWKFDSSMPMIVCSRNRHIHWAYSVEMWLRAVCVFLKKLEKLWIRAGRGWWKGRAFHLVGVAEQFTAEHFWRPQPCKEMACPCDQDELKATLEINYGTKDVVGGWYLWRYCDGNSDKSMLTRYSCLKNHQKTLKNRGDCNLF